MREVHLLCCKAAMMPHLYSTFDLITAMLKSYSGLSLQHHQIISLTQRDYGRCDAPLEQKKAEAYGSTHSERGVHWMQIGFRV